MLFLTLLLERKKIFLLFLWFRIAGSRLNKAQIKIDLVKLSSFSQKSVVMVMDAAGRGDCAVFPCLVIVSIMKKIIRNCLKISRELFSRIFS